MKALGPTDEPSIDLVCRRIIVKWELIMNIAHRYLACRCILRLSTPSLYLQKDELTFLVSAAALAIIPLALPPGTMGAW